MLQRQIELELERQHPGRFIARYAMVMFHDRIPYSVARERGRIQQQILDALTRGHSAGSSACRESIDYSAAATMIKDRLQPVA
jgi:kynurenine 3-monooxygenase